MESLDSNFSAQPTIYSREQHSLSRHDVDPDALKIMYRLIHNGYKAYLVGGGVRDLLLNKKPKDFDLVTDATPRRVKALFRNSRIIGRRFKLVHVFFGQGKIIEVATFRDQSDPVVESDENGEEEPPTLMRDNTYGDEVTDAQRRDLTVNALFYDASNFSIIDYVGGMKDLQDEVVRIIGNPDTRYIEDPVRMIRVVRHAARASFSIEQNTWEAIARNRHLLSQASDVRVFEEVKKDIAGGHLVETIRSLHDATLLELLLPELSENASLFFRPQSLFSKLLGQVDELCLASQPPPPTVGLALLAIATRDDGMGLDDLDGLFHDVDDLREHLAHSFTRLAVPRREREKIEQILCGWLYLSHTAPEKLNTGRLRIRDCRPEFMALLDIVDNSGRLLRTLRDLEGARASGAGHSPARSGNRRHAQRSQGNPVRPSARH